MRYKIEVVDKPGIFDAVGQGVEKDIFDLGISSVKEVKFIQVYLVTGNLTEGEVVSICEELLTDKVAQDYKIVSNHPALPDRPVRASAQHPAASPKANQNVIEIAYNPGVMDPVEESVLKGIRDLGISDVESVKTAKKYILYGKLSTLQLKTISEKLLYNKLIQHISPLQVPEEDT
ncbi:MAG: phosphoribosylformylglycinamidine synthase subunit PurS, partial [Candidatus Omnitrophota bacterium]